MTSTQSAIQLPKNKFFLEKTSPGGIQTRDSNHESRMYTCSRPLGYGPISIEKNDSKQILLYNTIIINIKYLNFSQFLLFQFILSHLRKRGNFLLSFIFLSLHCLFLFLLLLLLLFLFLLLFFPNSNEKYRHYCSQSYAQREETNIKKKTE